MNLWMFNPLPIIPFFLHKSIDSLCTDIFHGLLAFYLFCLENFFSTIFMLLKFFLFFLFSFLTLPFGAGIMACSWYLLEKLMLCILDEGLIKYIYVSWKEFYETTTVIFPLSIAQKIISEGAVSVLCFCSKLMSSLLRL